MIKIIKGDVSYLGKTVEITIDRPVGAEHPNHPDLIYPINYGYVEGLIAGDNEEQDVYILNSTEPVQRMKAVIIGIINREDDNEDKWCAVTEDYLDDSMNKPLLYEPYILEKVKFQEEFYTSNCLALYEKTCGTVCYTVADNQVKFLLVKNADSGHIGFPKGHIELNETEIETALREVFEETGLTVYPEDNFRCEYSYNLPNGVHKNCVYFVGEYKDSSLKIQVEELSEHWVLSFEDAIKKLNYQQDIDVLTEAYKHIKAGGLFD